MLMDMWGGNKATYLGMVIEKLSGPDFGGLILGPNNYGDKINNIGIPHERSKQTTETLAVDEQPILRSGFSELMRISRIARTGAIYDASTAARTFTD